MAVPSLAVITGGAYDRVGTDLIIQAPDGATYLVRDYFSQSPLPSLGLADGSAQINGDLVSRLAGPLAPAQVAAAGDQVAQAESPIGTIQVAKGTVTLKHTDGTITQAAVGDPVFSGDEVVSGPGAQVGITFLDGSEFALGADGRMVLDEMIYDPNAGEGSAQVSLLSGTFSFVSGQIAKMGPDQMAVQTPVATIGIRGTSGSISLDGGDEALFKVVLIPDPSGTVGEIQVTTPSGQTFSLNQPMNALAFTSTQARTFTMSASEFESTFGVSIDALQQGNDLRGNVQNVAPQESQDTGSTQLRQGPDGDKPQQDGGDPRGDGAPGDGEDQPQDGEGPAQDGEGQDGAPQEGENPNGEQPAEGDALGEAESQAGEIGTEGKGTGVEGSGQTGDGSATGGQETGTQGLDQGPDQGAGQDGGSKTITVTGQSGNSSSLSSQLQATGGTGTGAPGTGGTSGGTKGGTGTAGTGTAGTGVGTTSGANTGTGNETDSSVLPSGSGGSTGGGTTVPPVQFQTVTGTTPFDVRSSSGPYAVTGDNSNNTILTGSWSDTIDAKGGNDYVMAGAGNDTVYGGDGDDTLVAGSGAGNDLYYGGNTTTDSSQNDWLIYPSTSAGITVALQGAAGLSTASGVATGSEIGTDHIYGIEHVEGGSGADTITGNSAVNSLLGGAGADTLSGGAGGDVIKGGDGGDKLIGDLDAANDLYYGGDGSTDNSDSDHLTYSSATQSITLKLQGAVGLSTAYGTATGSEIGSDQIYQVEKATTGDGNDTLIGNSAANYLSGQGGDDMLDGGSGADTLYGGDGDDTLVGSGDGANDLYYGGTASADTNGTYGDLLDYSAITADLTVLLQGASGLSTSYGTGSSSSTGNDRLYGIERLVAGAGNDTLTGNSAANTLFGSDGNDTLDGGAGSDTLMGGNGDDLFIGGLDGASDVFYGGTGSTGDSVNDTISYAAATVGISLSLQGASGLSTAYGLASSSEIGSDQLYEIEHATGGAGADTLTGNSAANSLIGGAGNDSLSGGSGSDWIQGGDGDDTIVGDLDAANDTYDGGTGASDGGLNDWLDYSAATSDIYAYTLGAVSLSSGYGLATGSEIGSDTIYGIEHIKGGSGNDTLIGHDAANTLIGGDGNDILEGGNGADRLIGGTGRDFASFALGGTQGVVVSVDNTDGAGLLTVTDQFGATDTLSGIENFIGSSFNDSLTGGSTVSMEVEVFAGLGGNDTINGGSDINKAINMVSYAFDAKYGGSAAVVVNLTDGIATDGFGATDSLSNINGIMGTSGDDTLTGGNSQNDRVEVFFGLDGADSIEGGSGYDEVHYEEDTAFGGTAGVTVNFKTHVAVDGFGKADTLNGIESAVGTAQADTFVGGTLSDMGYYFAGLGGADSYTGDTTAGKYEEVRYDLDDRHGGTAGVVVDLANSTATDGFGATDSLTDIDGVRGTKYADHFTAAVGVGATFAGLDGADTLQGSSGVDEARYDYDAQYGGTSGIVADLSAGTVIDGFGKTDTLTAIEAVRGTASVDTITGNIKDNIIRGMGGADILDGGAGVDTVDYSKEESSSSSGVTVDLGAGTATDLSGATDTLSNFENVTGSAYNDVITDGSGNNLLTGLDGDDTYIWSGAGTDTIVDSAGNDRLALTTLDQNLSLYAGLDANGNVVLTYNSSHTLTIDASGTIETVQDTDGSLFTVYHNSNPTLTGSSGKDLLIGLNSGQTLMGGTGEDLLFGGVKGDVLYAGTVANDASDSSADYLYGGADNDLLYGNIGDNELEGGAGNDSLMGGDGSDRYIFRGTSIGFDTIIDSGGSNDVLDFTDYDGVPYWIDLDAGGTLTVQFDSDSTNGVSIANADSTGAVETVLSTDDNGTTATLGVVFAPSDAGAGNDLIIASDSALTTWAAGDGDDSLFLDGDLSSAHITMGAGNDEVFIDPTTSVYFDTIDGGTGTDKLYIQNDQSFSSSKILGIEELFLGSSVGSLYSGWDLANSLTSIEVKGSSTTWNLSESTGTLDLSGLSLSKASGLVIQITDYYSDSNDTIIGSQGRDDITYSAGNDVIHGQGGNDLLDISAMTSGASVSFDGGAGEDKLAFKTLTSGVTITYGTIGSDYGVTASASGATVTAINTESIYGSQGADTITGGSQDDFIEGYKGSDTLTGGAGSDTFGFTEFSSLTEIDAPDTITDWTTADKIALSYTKGGTVIFDAWADASDASTLRYAENSGNTIGPTAINAGFSGGGIYVNANGSDVEVWYTSNGSAADNANSYQIATLSGQNLDSLDASNFVNISPT